MSSYLVITICGSMRFRQEMISVAESLTRDGYIVLMPFVADFIGDPNKRKSTNGMMLDDMHRAKIRMSEAIYVVNKNGYIGDSTKDEIEYADKLYLDIIYMESK